jgi:clan AA aspartic protease (TIGR02281 family)
MMRLAKSLCLLLGGTVLGWWLHDVTSTGSLQQISATPSTAPLVKPAPGSLPNSSSPLESDASQVTASSALPNVARFRQLLMQQQFEEALAYYERALSLDDAFRGQLKPVLEQYLKSCLEQCVEGVFVEVVNLWLATYYEDIPVLLMLAEHQRLQGQPEEAASTLQLVATYAWQTEHQGDVNAAVQRLVMATDETLSRQENWVELLGFYEYLETIDLGTREFLLREAILYRVLGEAQRSRELLLELRERDNQLNSEWTAALEQQLSLISPQSAAGDRPGHAVAVTGHGDHFLVEATLNRRARVKLLIDTGASLTTLSQASFNDLPKSNFKYRGSRMFNTANGLTRGDVYRVASIRLGDIQLDDIDIAVLDYASAPGVDGLLGMNVLRYYRFEIDQDDSLLHLHPR